MTIFEAVVECFLWLDIYMDFRRAYENPESGMIVVDRKLIALHYFKSWFIVDFMASFPYQIVIESHPPYIGLL